MRKCKTPILIATTVLLLVGMLLFATREKDPVYQGKPLSQYLQNLRGEGLSMFNGDSLEPRLDLELADSKAVEAIPLKKVPSPAYDVRETPARI